MAKKATGRIDRTTAEERHQVALLKASGLSNRAIARQTNRARQTIASILASEDVDRLRVQARDILDRHQVPMAESFLEAVKVGAAKGRYEGAYHGLLSLGVISRPDDTSAGPRTVVHIGQVIVDVNRPPAVAIEELDLPVVETENEPLLAMARDGDDH